MSIFDDAFKAPEEECPQGKRLTNVTERYVEVECCDFQREQFLYEFNGYVEDAQGNPRQVQSQREVPLTKTRGGIYSPQRIQCARCMLEFGRQTWLYIPYEGNLTRLGNPLCPECLEINDMIASKWFGLFAKLFNVRVW